ncbi:hypothetical protein NDU88_005363 [Pleurodeles waltl]|uniref:Uncharacterized protein n=1 Tax=Pleurodeles waltl TaxID=8319 RepID=A0AAV7MW46_PLEWA|nr:hypothetical protein NDU88_005363 [Pleurodeles waltl]
MGKQGLKSQVQRPLSPDSEQGVGEPILHQPMKPPLMQATLQKILEAIEESKNTLRQEIGKVWKELSHLKADHQKLYDRVNTTEEELTRLGTQQPSHETHITHLTDKVQRIEYQAKNAEGHSHRNNVLIIELLQGSKGADMVAFLKHWMKSLIDEQQFTTFFALEKEHRVPPKPPVPGWPP